MEPLHSSFDLPLLLASPEGAPLQFLTFMRLQEAPADVLQVYLENLPPCGAIPSPDEPLGAFLSAVRVTLRDWPFLRELCRYCSRAATHLVCRSERHGPMFSEHDVPVCADPDHRSYGCQHVVVQTRAAAADVLPYSPLTLLRILRRRGLTEDLRHLGRRLTRMEPT